MTRAISLAALTVLELTPPEMVTCAAEAGFSHVRIRLLPATPNEAQYDVVGDTPLLREVERRLADTGVKVLDVEIFRIRPDTRVGDYEAAIATAARLGASELLVAGNDLDEGRLIDCFAAFCDLADSYGLGASLEFMPWTDAKNLTQAARIVERASRANAGVLIDPFHLSRSRSRIEDIATIPPFRLRFMQFCDVPAAIRHVSKRFCRHLWDLAIHGRAMQLVNGVALIGRLAKSAEKLGVQLIASALAKRLLLEEGAVRGAVISTAQGEVEIRAAKGVVLAAGGFPNDVQRRQALFPRTPTGREHFALPPESCSGDGISLGVSAGACLVTDLASPVAWAPVSLVKHADGSIGHFPHIIDRAKPGVIGVLADGKRFVNEADGYYDYTSAMVASVPEGQEVASWLICDHRFQRRYGLGYAKPFPLPVTPYLRSAYLKRAASIEELATLCGIDPKGLADTVKFYNEHARGGEDVQFGRDSTAYNRKQGDPLHAGPNPCVAPIEHGPFYAVKVLPGSFGTFAGLKTNGFAQVLDHADQPISGLYAVGTDMASVMGGFYPSGGINLGPAMTFGYIAGRHAAGVVTYEDDEPMVSNRSQEQAVDSGPVNA